MKGQITLVQVLTWCNLGQVNVCTNLHNQPHRVNGFPMPGCFRADHPVLNENSVNKLLQCWIWTPSGNIDCHPHQVWIVSLPSLRGISLFSCFHCPVNRIALSLVWEIRSDLINYIDKYVNQAFQRAFHLSLGISLCFGWAKLYMEFSRSSLTLSIK